jgi:hypothetical protein
LLLLTDAALNSYYDLRTIYFWNTERHRAGAGRAVYARSTPPEQQPTEVLKWLTAGPAPWLAAAVEPLPEGNRPDRQRAAVSNDKLQINLNAQAVPTDDKTCPGPPTAAAHVVTATQSAAVSGAEDRSPVFVWDQNGFLSSNASSGLSGDPERFVVFEGKIRRLSRSASAAEPVPVLPADANRNIRMAALAGPTTVRTRRGGRRRWQDGAARRRRTDRGAGGVA